MAMISVWRIEHESDNNNGNNLRHFGDDSMDQ